jgi:hypothetical protein
MENDATSTGEIESDSCGLFERDTLMAYGA